MATILDLLQALNRGDLPPLPGPAPSAPIPYAPVPNLGPLSTDTTAAFGALNPEPVPPAILPPAPADQNFVSSYAGQEPVRPTVQPPTTLQKIAAVLSGIGAGPEYGMALKKQREDEVRTYQRQREIYDDRRTRGLEIAERRSEREADQANRAAERQYEREYQQWVRKTGVRDAEAKTLLRQAFDLNVLRERERIADEKQQKAIDAATEKQRRDIEDELASKDGAPPSVAREISEYRVGKRPGLSAAAEKWRGLRAKKLEAQLARVGGSGGGGAGPVMAQLQNGQVVPLSAVDKQSGGVMLNGDLVPVVGYVGGRIPSRPQQQPQTSATPAPMFSFENMLQAPSYMSQPSGQTFSRAQVNAYARKNKRKPADVEADLKARGFKIE